MHVRIRNRASWKHHEWLAKMAEKFFNSIHFLHIFMCGVFVFLHSFCMHTILICCELVKREKFPLLSGTWRWLWWKILERIQVEPFLTNTTAITLKEYEWNYITVIVIATVKWWAKLQMQRKVAINVSLLVRPLLAHRHFFSFPLLSIKERGVSKEIAKQTCIHAIWKCCKNCTEMQYLDIYRYFRYFQSFMHSSICYKPR